MEKSNNSTIIIGGGIIGLSCALRLAQEGLKVTIFEADTCGSKSTTAALGFLIPYAPNIGKAIAELQRGSLEQYQNFADELKELSGVDIEYQRLGHIQVLYSKMQYQKALDTLNACEKENITVDGNPAFEILDKTQALALESNLPDSEFGYMLSRLTAHLSTTKITQALKISCQKLGVEIFENSAIEDILIEDNTAKGVIFNGNKITADSVLIATGAYSSKFSSTIDNLKEIQAQKGDAIEVKLDKQYFKTLVKIATFYIFCKEDGTTLIGSTSSRKPDFSTQVTEKSINMLIKGAKKVIPEISKEKINRAWYGHRPHSYLGSPLLGKCQEAKNLYVATGHGKIGVCTAPITALAISQLIAYNNEVLDFTPFNVNKLKKPGSKD